MTTDNYFDHHFQTQSMPSNKHYSSSYRDESDDDDDDLDALRKAALQTLNSRKRKVGVLVFLTRKSHFFFFAESS